MSKVYFISDLHLGHRKILEFSPERKGSTVDEHDEWIIKTWNSVVTKRDTVFVLGDVAFSRKALNKVKLLKGNKKLILGNHDQHPIELYMEHFSIAPSLFKYKNFWLSHFPIHPNELRGKHNIHGHSHSKLIPDSRYINVCVEIWGGKPVPFHFIEKFYSPE